jgi:hypothetical protein
MELETQANSVLETKSDIITDQEEIVFEVKISEPPVQIKEEKKTLNISEQYLEKIRSLFGKVITDEHLKLYKLFLDQNDPGLLLDLSSYSVFIEQTKQKEFTSLIDNLRKHLGVIVTDEKDCRNRLLKLRSKSSNQSDGEIINNAMKLLDYPEQSEVTSNADFELFNLRSRMNGRREIIEIQELFLYLNSMLEVPQTNNNKGNKRK